jgi:hypothetical protein
MDELQNTIVFGDELSTVERASYVDSTILDFTAS